MEVRECTVKSDIVSFRGSDFVVQAEDFIVLLGPGRGHNEQHGEQGQAESEEFHLGLLRPMMGIERNERERRNKQEKGGEEKKIWKLGGN